MKLSRILLVITLAVSACVVTAPAPVAAQDIADGCTVLNDPFWDGYSSQMAHLAAVYFLAGDVITIDAQPPDEPPPTTTFSFILGSQTLGSQLYPGTLVIPFATARTGPGFEFVTTPETFMTFDVSCVPASGPRTPPTSPVAAPAASVPGCDLSMQLTNDAAVGTFVADTTVLWGPDANAMTTLTMPAGKTAWVLGVDDSGQFYKFAWSCSYLWAPVSMLGPNFDAVWDGTPLPISVVE